MNDFLDQWAWFPNVTMKVCW